MTYAYFFLSLRFIYMLILSRHTKQTQHNYSVSIFIFYNMSGKNTGICVQQCEETDATHLRMQSRIHNIVWSFQKKLNRKKRFVPKYLNNYLNNDDDLTDYEPPYSPFHKSAPNIVMEISEEPTPEFDSQNNQPNTSKSDHQPTPEPEPESKPESRNDAFSIFDFDSCFDEEFIYDPAHEQLSFESGVCVDYDVTTDTEFDYMAVGKECKIVQTDFSGLLGRVMADYFMDSNTFDAEVASMLLSPFPNHFQTMHENNKADVYLVSCYICIFSNANHDSIHNSNLAMCSASLFYRVYQQSRHGQRHCQILHVIPCPLLRQCFRLLSIDKFKYRHTRCVLVFDFRGSCVCSLSQNPANAFVYVYCTHINSRTFFSQRQSLFSSISAALLGIPVNVAAAAGPVGCCRLCPLHNRPQIPFSSSTS
jgi:hypothetical protein